MKPFANIRQSVWFAVLVFFASRVSQVFANPTGLTVGAGQATAQPLGSSLNVTVSQLAVLNWQNFNIAAGETTSFLQPSANSVVFNVIGDHNPSQIFGSLHANGTVILANASGFYFGPDSMIKVGGSFIATTSPLTPDFGSGAPWQFTGMPPLASIVNYGQIEVGHGRSLFLIAENIQNHGSLTAPAGDVGLYAGNSVLVSESPDGRGLSAAVTLPKGSVDNFGRVTADAGTIALEANVVNQDGILQANSVQNQNGVIELVASDSLHLGANSQILAQGDSSATGSAGGEVTLKADNMFSDTAGSTIATTGGANGGNGGNVEVSAPNIQSLDSAMAASAQAGFRGGEFLLDPVNIILGTSGNDPVPANGTVPYNTSGTFTLNVNTAFANKNFSQILLQASGDITLNANTTLNLSSATGQSAGQLTMEAGGDIVFNSNSKISDANAWNVSLYAGYGFTSGNVQAGTGSIYLDGSNGGTLNGSIQTTKGNIYLAAGQSIQLGTGTVGTSGGNVTWQSGGDITFGKGSTITTKGSGGVTLDAGYDFANDTVSAASGNIYLGGTSGGTVNGSITTVAGDINLLAEQNVLVGSGSVYSKGGGSIFAAALTGNLNAGTANGGSSKGGDYNFQSFGYSPAAVLGGIATAAGGNVTLIAGNNIDSTATPISGKIAAASGTYGSGNVTVIAGNQITGNYNLANGVGTLLAGVQASAAQVGALQKPNVNPLDYAATLQALETAVKQSQNTGGNIGSPPSLGNPSTSPVTLGLIKGSWNAWAANDISLKQVLNPNGAFNNSQSFLYNYAADAAVNLWSGNAIELVGGSFGNVASSVSVTPIYAPRLSLNAGAGGILVDTSIILAPSGVGSLSIVTRNGGNLVGAPIPNSTVLTGITMSDSGSTDYNTFSTGHAAGPLHQNDPNSQPVLMDISGSIGSFSLTVPTFADITVEGTQPFTTSAGQNIFGTYNFAFSGRNLSPSQTTSINVLGTITYRGDVTPINLTPEQLADPLPVELFADSANRSVTDGLRYDLNTGQLIYVGVMSSDALNFLKNPMVLVLDKNGHPLTQLLVGTDGTPILDAAGNLQYVNVTRSLTLDATQKGMIDALYNATADATLGSQGLAVTGAGHFNVSANTMDLGVSAGITVQAPDAALAALSSRGADLNITTVGNLSMTSTTIANQSLFGDINLNVGGALNLGGQFTAYDPPSTPKGIFTSSGGNISVIVNGDVNVNGSRIAAYNGGSLTVLSKTGNINAGSGVAGYISVSALIFEPHTGQLVLDDSGQPQTLNESIPGSGILATTLFGSDATLGNITINAPNGSLNANRGGVLQIAFNGSDAHSFIDIHVAHDINATGSGIIGSNVKLLAGGNINGAVIGSQSVNVNAPHGNVDVTVVSGGSVNISAGGSVAGTIVGGGDVSVSGDSITAAVSGGSVATSGDAAGASLGLPQANAPKEVTETTDASSAGTTTDSPDDLKKKKGISLAQKVSRVTVILPPKNLSEKSSGNNPL